MIDTKSTCRMVLAAALLGAVAACSDPTRPADPPPEPEAQLEPRWDVDVTVRYVRASSQRTCDGLTLIGTVNPGEYQYRIRASYGDTRYETRSRGYNQVTGTSYTLGRSEIENFANETWRFTNLRQGESVALTLNSTEWDGTSRDDYMNDRGNSLSVTPSSLLPTGGTKADRALGVGTANCGLTLYYDVTVVQRQVIVG